MKELLRVAFVTLVFVGGAVGLAELWGLTFPERWGAHKWAGYSPKGK